MKKLMIMLLLSTAIYAQETKLTAINSLSILTGSIDGKYPITMYLWVNEKDSEIRGKYYYNNQKKWIDLNDTSIPQDNNIVLIESVDGKTSGVFQGKYLSNNGFKGMWSSSAKSFPFDLKVQLSIDIYSYQYKSNDIYIKEEGIQINSSNMQEFNNEYKISARAIEDCENEYRVSYDGFYLNPKNQILSFRRHSVVWNCNMMRPGYEQTFIMYNLKTGERLATSMKSLIQSVVDPKFMSTFATAAEKQGADYYHNSYDYRITLSGIEFWDYGSNDLTRESVEFTYNEIKEFIKPSMRYLFE